MSVLLPNSDSTRSTASSAVRLRTSSAGLTSTMSSDANRPLSIVIAVVAAGGIVAAVVVSKRRSAVIGDDPGTPAEPTAAPPAPEAEAPDTVGPADEPAPTQQFEPTESR